jgi:hypothetical protein
MKAMDQIVDNVNTKVTKAKGETGPVGGWATVTHRNISTDMKRITTSHTKNIRNAENTTKNEVPRNMNIVIRIT